MYLLCSENKRKSLVQKQAFISCSTFYSPLLLKLMYFYRQLFESNAYEICYIRGLHHSFRVDIMHLHYDYIRGLHQSFCVNLMHLHSVFFPKDELQLKISELQSKPGVMTGTESANIQELQGKVIQLEKDRSFHTTLIQDHGSSIQDHGTRITQLEAETAANTDSIQKQGAIISKIETDKTEDQTSYHNLNNTLENLTIDIAANKDEIQMHQTRLNEIESILTIDQDNIQTLNDTIFRITSDTSLNIANSQLMMELLNSSIRTLETNLTSQSMTINDHSLRLAQIETEMEHATTFRDLNSSLLELETNLTSLGVAVSNNSLNINQIHADVEGTYNSLVNLTFVTNSIEVDIQSDSATIEENQRRISRVELDNNATKNLYQTMESRLTYLEGTHTFIHHR